LASAAGGAALAMNRRRQGRFWRLSRLAHPWDRPDARRPPPKRRPLCP